MDFDKLSHQVIGLGIEVHKHLGPGLLESVYQKCLAFELELNGIQFLKEVDIPVIYKGQDLEMNYRIDLLIENRLIVELKAVETILGIHKAQLLTYMKLTKIKTGLLMNFNSPVLKNGIQRFVL